MFWRLSLAYTLLLLASVGLLDLVVLGRVERYNLERVESDLRVKAILVREMVRGSNPETLQDRVHNLNLGVRMRVTLIESGGRVLADSEEDPNRMDNHAERPEVRQAQQEGFGTGIRFSNTVLQ